MALFLIALVLACLSLHVNAFNLTATQLCGFEQRCTGNISNFDRINNSCCQPCECTDVCKEKDTCCLDKESRPGDENVTRQECIPAVYSPDDEPFPGSSQTYFVRNSCPNTFIDLEIKDKCEGNIPETLDDIVFVSSEDGTVVYKNRFCGLCHGEQKPVPWETMINEGCMTRINTEENRISVSSIVEKLLTMCRMVFKRPEMTPLLPILCYRDSSFVIHECNITRKWKQNDTRLVNLCRDTRGSFHYFHKSIAKTVVFGNMYCYPCNVESFTVPETCHLQQLDSGRSSYLLTLLDPNRGYPRSHSNHKKLETINDETCEEGRIFETFLGVCKKLYCPVLTVPVDGECVQFVENANGFHHSVDIQLVSDEEIKQLDVDKNGIVYLYNFIKRRLMLGTCALCGGNMYVSRDNTTATVSDIYAKFTLVTSPECTRDHILSKVAMLEISNFTAKIRLEQNLVRFAGYVREPWKWEVTQWDLVSTFRNCFSAQAFNSDRRSNCPKFKLTSGEYYRVLHNHKRAKELLFLWNPNDVNSAVYVCLDNYLQVDKPRGAGVENHIYLATIITTVSIITFKSFVFGF